MAPVELQAVVCGCGCGEQFIPKRKEKARFIFGHHSRLPRKAVPRTVTPRLRNGLYASANDCCQQCGLSMAEQMERLSPDYHAVEVLS